MANENICRFNKFGYCKFKTNCKYKHVNVVCDDENCDKSVCEKRHPRNCKYFINSGDCKLGSNCAYAHKDNNKMKMEKLEQKIIELHKIIENKEKIINRLVNDVQNLKSFVEINNESETIDENATLEENVSDLYDAEIAHKKTKEFIAKSKEHLDKMQKEIKKSRKNLRVKYKNIYDKMEAEIVNFDLDPGVFDRHHHCEFVIWQLEDHLKKPEKDNEKEEKEEMMKVFEWCQSRFNQILEEMEYDN